MIYDTVHSTPVVDHLRQNGVFLYVNTGKTEPTYIAGPGRPATLEDLDAAMRFLQVLRSLIVKGEA